MESKLTWAGMFMATAKARLETFYISRLVACIRTHSTLELEAMFYFNINKDNSAGRESILVSKNLGITLTPSHFESFSLLADGPPFAAPPGDDLLLKQEGTQMKLMTDAIGANGFFDSRYTCDIDNSSPEIHWENPPPRASGFALLAEDPDAPQGVFTHWIIYHIPAGVRHLPAGIPPQESLPNGIRQGSNSFGKLGYAGPCPPQGDRAHRYFFKLYALSDLPILPHRVQRDEFLRAISPLMIEEASIVGLYKRTIQKAG